MICSRLAGRRRRYGADRSGAFSPFYCFRCCRRRWRRPFHVCGWSFTTRPTMLVAQLLKGRLILASGHWTTRYPNSWTCSRCRRIRLLPCCTATIRSPRRHMFHGNSWWAGILPFSQRQYSAAGQCACRKPPSVPADPLSGGLYRDIIRAGALEACRGDIASAFTPPTCRTRSLRWFTFSNRPRRARWR